MRGREARAFREIAQLTSRHQSRTVEQKDTKGTKDPSELVMPASDGRRDDGRYLGRRACFRQAMGRKKAQEAQKAWPGFALSARFCGHFRWAEAFSPRERDRGWPRMRWTRAAGAFSSADSTVKLWQTRRHWEKLARTDPLWAVLTDPTKAGNRWEVDEFFASGRREIEAVLAEVRGRCPGLRRGRALDFGCGVGRLTQALADHFERVTGVDIAEEMLALARRYNRKGERVEYVHNTEADLAGLAAGSFDFVGSLITLQHIAPEYSRRYIAEFLRVLAPGGVAYFQVPAAGCDATRERWKHSFWPPTLATRLRRFGYRFLNRQLALAPFMEMHAIPPDEIADIVAKNGGILVATDRHTDQNRIEHHTYLAIKSKP